MKVWFTSFVIAALAALAAPAMAQSSVEERAFAERYLPWLEAGFPDRELALEPNDPLQVNISGEAEEDGPGMVNLHRMFLFCQTLTQVECDAEVGAFVAALVREPDKATAENLRLIVRDGQYWTAIRQTVADGDALPIHKQIGEDLYAILALDSPDSISMVGPGLLEDLGVEGEAAWALAREQTSAVVPRLPEGLDLGESLNVFEGEEYVGSLALYVDLWESVGATNGTDLAVIVSSDNFVLAAVMPEGDDLEVFKKLAKDLCDTAARCISPNVYRLRDGSWMIAD